MKCKFCGGYIRVQIFKGEDWCSDNCRKALQENGRENDRLAEEETGSGKSVNGRRGVRSKRKT